ncbi:MAG: four helix bundle protein [Bacteroidota bacterium]
MNKDWIKKLQNRSFEFALSSIRLFQQLPPQAESKIIGKQMMRAATSVGANYRAACRAKSLADFVYKLKIVVEEADEVEYWLSLLMKVHPEKEASFAYLMNEASALRAIFSKSMSTAKQKLKSR